MKRLLVAVALAAAALLPAAAQAAPLQVKLVAASGTVGGGPFGFAIKPGDDIADFVSFCMELGEDVSLNATYFVQLAKSAKAGGVGGAVGGEDPLDPRTAYLYTSLLGGTLVGFTGSLTSQNALQLAIWRIEEELGSDYGGRGDAASRALADVFYQAAVDAGWQDIGRVRVARLWLNYDETSGFSGNAQDVLMVPEPGSILLVGMGLLGLAGAVRRRGRR